MNGFQIYEQRLEVYKARIAEIRCKDGLNEDEKLYRIGEYCFELYGMLKMLFMLKHVSYAVYSDRSAELCCLLNNEHYESSATVYVSRDEFSASRTLKTALLSRDFFCEEQLLIKQMSQFPVDPGKISSDMLLSETPFRAEKKG